MGACFLSQTAPIIVTALLGDADFAWADALRRAHFPAERNLVPAHVTLFHHLPPSALDEVRALAREAAQSAAPPARLAGLMRLGGGVAFRIDSPALAVIRDGMADRLHGLLMPQDQAAWRPHLTIQNKVATRQAAALYDRLLQDFGPRPIAIAGLALWRYRDGPWEAIARHMFAGRRPG